MITISKNVECPKCGTQNKVSIDFNEQYSHPKMVVLCEPEHGGCDEMFVVTAGLQVCLNVYAVITPLEYKALHD